MTIEMSYFRLKGRTLFILSFPFIS